MSDNKPTSQHTPFIDRFGTSNWGITFGLAAAVLLAGILYFSFSGDLIDERSTAVPPTETSAPQPLVPSTR